MSLMMSLMCSLIKYAENDEKVWFKNVSQCKNGMLLIDISRKKHMGYFNPLREHMHYLKTIYNIMPSKCKVVLHESFKQLPSSMKIECAWKWMC